LSLEPARYFLQDQHLVATNIHVYREKGEGVRSRLRFSLYYYTASMRNMFRPKNKKSSSGEIRALPLQRQWKQAYITTMQRGV